MFPGFSFNYIKCSCLANGEFFCNFSVCNHIGMIFSYFSYDILRELCLSVFFTLRRYAFRSMNFTERISPFFKGISHIIFLCSGKKMFGIYAGRHIASMTNIMSFFYGPVKKFVGKTMGIYYPLFFRKHKHSVTSSSFSVFPDPATIRFYYVLPESIFAINFHSVSITFFGENC